MPKKSTDYQCPECDAPPFSRPHGLSRHRSQTHGVMSPTAAKKGRAEPKLPSRPRRKGAPVPSSSSPNGAGRYADAIAALESEASQLEADANVLRQAAKRLLAASA